MTQPILNIKKGDAPKSAATIAKAKIQRMNALGYPENTRSALMQRQMMAMAQGADDPAYLAAMPVLAQFEADLAATLEINTFNAQLAAYRPAVARLEKIDLAAGREAYEEGTGQFEPDPETGEPVEVMRTVEAVPPLVAEDVEYLVIDEATGEPTGETVTEPDREVVARLEKDAAERAAAQAVVDATPQEVKDFDAG